MQQNKIIFWVVLGGVLLIVIVSGAAYFLTRTPAETVALPVAVAQPTTPANTEPSPILPVTTNADKVTQPQVNATKFPVWKTITLGTYKNSNALHSALVENGFEIDEDATSVMSNPAFVLSLREKQVDLVVVSVADLGFKKGAEMKVIYGRAEEMGLALCPSEVGPQLRLQYKNQT
jgi:hypothetical protein